MIHLYAHIPFFTDTNKKYELVNATLDPRLHQIGTNMGYNLKIILGPPCLVATLFDYKPYILLLQIFAVISLNVSMCYFYVSKLGRIR